MTNLTRFPGFIDRLPPAVYLLIVIGVAVLTRIIFTSDKTQDELTTHREAPTASVQR